MGNKRCANLQMWQGEKVG